MKLNVHTITATNKFRVHKRGDPVTILVSQRDGLVSGKYYRAWVTQTAWASADRHCTITKMYWLKLDPYRCQTESWSRQGDATGHTHPSLRAHTHTTGTHHYSYGLINARGEEQSHYLRLHLRVRLLIWFWTEVFGEQAASSNSL